VTRPFRGLDLFCGAGGASEGYHRAGFEMFGVDCNPQPHYPFEFHQGDAMRFPLDGFDFIHASPPCQDHSTLRTMHDGHGNGWMLAATIERLEQHGAPFIVENVPGSGPALGGQWVQLCGSSFGLKVRRHRLFRSNLAVLGLPCAHKTQGQPVGVYGTGGGGQMTRGYKARGVAEAGPAMDIDWMNRAEISQAIPPAYTEFIGRQLLAYVEAAA
jgi:DNA (cytosine-5)-methyltransferase 1